MGGDMPKRAAAIIVRDGNVLLMRRVKDGEEYFVFPGGLVEEGETPQEAAVREIHEEFNLEVRHPQALFEMESMGKQGYYYLCTDVVGEPVLGGEELRIMNDRNQYYPVWKPVADIQSISNLYPDEVREKVAEMLSMSQ